MTTRLPLTRLEILWPTRPLPGGIQPEEVHLWAWNFGGEAAPLEDDINILDEREKARTARFHFTPDRIRYSVCHANLRRILASYLHQAPESLTFREAGGGKPKLANTDLPLRFNLSHSKTLAVLAIALDKEVGVDVEDIRPIEVDVAKRFFSKAEFAALQTLTGLAWLDGFYRCWTRKEAILKAEGMGLRIPLDSFDVSFLADEPARLLAARPESKLTASWKLHDLAVADGTMGALAVADPAVRQTMSSFPG